MLKSPQLPDMTSVDHHPAVQDIAEYLSVLTMNNDLPLFRTIAASYLVLPASILHAKIRGENIGLLPINSYTIALAGSGDGKGTSVGAMQETFLKGFRDTFVDMVLPELAEDSMRARANREAARNGTEEEEEFQNLMSQYNGCGAYAWDFDSGSVEAMKQIRDKILIGGAGALFYKLDEMGSHLDKQGTGDMLAAFLELYDKGYIGQKIRMNNAERRRVKEINGMSPTNMLLFGEPNVLFNSSRAIEDRFYSLMETGMARRCLFAHGHKKSMIEGRSSEEIYDLQTSMNVDNNLTVKRWVTHLTSLADANLHNWVIDMPKDVAVGLIEYRLMCEAVSDTMSQFETMRIKEMRHRHFKAMKLAGAYAFLDQATTMTMAHLEQAIKLVEESGVAFQNVLTRDKNYMKLARYIVEKKQEVTHADLDAELPFYPSSQSARSLMMTDAVAWGYKNNILIKKKFSDGIDFFDGDSLPETSLDDMMFSYSDDYGYGYGSDESEVPFSDLHILTQAQGLHWCNHSFENGHRHSESTLPGFNMLVFDVDDKGADLALTQSLLSDYAFMTYTTKRHNIDENGNFDPDVQRFRLIMPTNYVLKLNEDEYRTFMQSVMDWLPIPNEALDPGAKERCRKWETYDKGTYFYSKGTQLIDILPFVPKTSRNEEYQNRTQDLKNLDAFERWFAGEWGDGRQNNRNALMIRYALAMTSSGLPYAAIEESVLKFNEQLPNSLDERELQRTVLQTVAQRSTTQP